VDLLPGFAAVGGVQQDCLAEKIWYVLIRWYPWYGWLTRDDPTLVCVHKLDFAGPGDRLDRAPSLTGVYRHFKTEESILEIH
jgi:hypothetical protein